jgi:hypothetical protein
MISSDGGATKPAPFEGRPATGGEPTGYSRVAFRVDGAGFPALADRLPALSILSSAGRADVVDHDCSFSVYFSHPYGHRCEVTTYDCEYGAALVQTGGREARGRPRWRPSELCPSTD